MRDDETEDTPEISEPGWSDRVGAVVAAAGRLLETRKAIFQEELSEKGSLLARGMLAIFVALLFGTIAGLLLTALVAALLGRLFGNPALGILATLLLYLGIAAAAGWIGWKKLEGLRPLEYPATGREIDRDLEVVARAAGIRDRETSEPPEVSGPRDRGASGESAEEMEARLREGAG